MHFDWYQATVQASSEEVLSWFRRVWPDGEVRPSKPKNGAAFGAQVVIGEMRVAECIWGGGMEGHGVNLWSSGGDSAFFAEVVRRRWPEHRVTRADSAADVRGEGAWEFWSAWALELADRFKLKVEHQGDWHRGKDGRTLYIGSRSSPVRLVIYEKGKQLPELGMPDWVRLELRVQPKKAEAGEVVAKLTPEQLWRCSRWSLAAADYIFGENGWERVVIGTRWNPADRERAVRAFIKQYAGVLGEWAGDLGGWSELGEEIGRRITAAAEKRREAIASAQAARAAPSLQAKGIPAGNADSCQQHAQAAHL